MPLCALCERDVPQITVHHLVPRSRGKRGQVLPTADLCSACHRQIHALYSNEHLERELGNLDRLRDDPQVQRFVKWVRKQAPARRVSVRR
ncbi:HNH endonuclease [Deinococcus pimensis]|uniref:HNH endonuclease n=1 Tax=Deinococcus pimensis TaxID=309888 RepID=UPI00048A0D8C|nr:HNH endonuclease [Deinococcus pimensis]